MTLSPPEKGTWMFFDSMVYGTLLCIASLVMKQVCWREKSTPPVFIVYAFILHFIVYFAFFGSQSGEWSRAFVMMTGTIMAIAAYLHLSGDIAYYRAKYPKPVKLSRIRGPEDHPDWSNYHPL